jgi:hypothetical protein
MMPCEGPVRSTRQFLSPGAIKFHEMGVQPRRSLLAAENWTASRRPTGSPSRAGRRTGSVRGQVHAASSWFQSALPSIGCDLSPHSPDDLSGGKLDKAASRRRQGRMASGRTLHARRLHRHQHAGPAANVVAFYNKRGTCEQWIKEGKGAIRWMRLSCRSFAANASASCPQSRQLPAHARHARDDQRLVADEPQGALCKTF